MFTTLIIRPIFNLLVLIYAILPGHNFGLSIIVFTIVVRLLLWPLVKKQLYQAKAMRKIQPELKKIKAAAKGDKRKEQAMLMELYKERGVNPFGSIGLLILQIPILIGLYSGIRRVVSNPHAIVTFAYPSLQKLSFMKELAHNIHLFDGTLFGFVNLTRAAIGHNSGIYWPAMVIVLGSAIVQFFQSKQLLPDDKNARKLRDILRGASSGKSADQAEVNAAVGRSTRYFLPAMVFLFTVDLASALSLYWLVGGLVAYIQQAYVLRGDEEKMEVLADKPATAMGSVNAKNIIEGEVVETPQNPKPTKKKPSRSKKKKKR